MSTKRTPEQLARKRELYKLNKEKWTPEEYARQSEMNRVRYQRRAERARKEARDWQKRNPEKYVENKKRWVIENQEYIKEYNRQDWIKNKEKELSYQRERAKTDPNFCITRRLRSSLYQAFKSSGTKKASKTFELIGIPIQEFRTYIESKFLPGMTWENRSEWHLDHERPCASFDLTDPNQQKECFHYKNLQPLWGGDNVKKSSTYKGRFHRHSDHKKQES